MNNHLELEIDLVLVGKKSTRNLRLGFDTFAEIL